MKLVGLIKQSLFDIKVKLVINLVWGVYKIIHIHFLKKHHTYNKKLYL